MNPSIPPSPSSVQPILNAREGRTNSSYSGVAWYHNEPMPPPQNRPVPPAGNEGSGRDLPHTISHHGMAVTASIQSMQQYPFISRQPPISYPWNHPINPTATIVPPLLESDDERKRPREGAPFPDSTTKRRQVKDGEDDDEEEDCTGIATEYRPSISMNLKLNDDDGPGPAPVEESMDGIENFRDNDVLSGRGGGTNLHMGNRNFRDLINFHRRTYLQARKNDKPAISRAVVRAIRESGGRFLKKMPKSHLWHEIGDDAAREKTSQALRQRAPEMRRLLFTNFECDPAGECSQQQQQQKRLMKLMSHGPGGIGMENPMRVWPGHAGLDMMNPPAGLTLLVPATKAIEKSCTGDAHHQQLSGMSSAVASIGSKIS